MSIKFIFLVSCLFVFAGAAMAASGDLDPAFNGSGQIISSFSKIDDQLYDVALQSDGRSVSVGRIWNSNGTQSFLLARFNSDGTIDASFGNGGHVITSFGTTHAWAEGVIIQPDGKIVACGYAANGGASSFAVARYLPDGSLDPGFSDDGKVMTSFAGGDAAANALALQYDGKIVAAGGGGQYFRIAKYNTDGTLDVSFGTGGKVSTSFHSQSSDTAYSVKIQSNNGKIVVAGDSRRGVNSFFAIARYRSSGTLDRTFNGDGRITTSFGAGDNAAFDVEVDSGGRVLAGGYYKPDGDHGYFAIARYTSKGLLDVTFDGDGMVTTVAGTRDSVIYDMALQPDGKIIAGGEGRDLDQGNNSNSFLMRYNSDGALDAGFGTGGIVQNEMSPFNDLIYAVALQGDGRIVTAGAVVDGLSVSDSALARYLNDGSKTSDNSKEKAALFYEPKPLWFLR